MNNSSYEGVAISTELDPYSTSRLRSVDEPLEVLSKSGWVAFVQKYFFAAIIGSDEYIYNYYVLPKESGFYRMGYTVEGRQQAIWFMVMSIGCLLVQRLEKILWKGLII